MKQTARNPANPILVQAYWDRPVPREHGDPDSKPIYHAVGYALTQWEDADQALIDLFRELTRTGGSIESRYTMSHSYSSIESHRARRIVLAATAEAYFYHHRERHDLRQPVAKIVNAAEWAADRRDDIAHGIAWQSISIDGRDVGSFLMPPEYRCEPASPAIPDAEDPFGFVRARYRYTSADILSFAAKFGDLREIIWDCTSEIDRARPISAD
jgi:hypothetical protein